MTIIPRQFFPFSLVISYLLVSAMRSIHSSRFQLSLFVPSSSLTHWNICLLTEMMENTKNEGSGQLGLTYQNDTLMNRSMESVACSMLRLLIFQPSTGSAHWYDTLVRFAEIWGLSSAVTCFWLQHPENLRQSLVSPHIGRNWSQRTIRAGTQDR